MVSSPSIWKTCLGPSLEIGLLASVMLFVATGSLVAASVCLLACLSGAVGTAWLTLRHAQRASVALRCSELRQACSRNLGVFFPIVNEAVHLLDQVEKEAKANAEARTQLEALTSVRQKKTRQLVAALQILDTPVLITDPHDELQYCNQAALRLFDIATNSGAEDVPFQSLDLDFLEPVKNLLVETRQRNAATDQRAAEFEIKVRGETIAYRARATNIYGERGPLIGVVVVLSDIRDERESKTRHAEFVSSVSHEMKTPMASIKAFIEMLIDGDVTDPEEQVELFRFIDTQIDRLTRMVNSMLNLARIESGVIKVQREDCELNGQLQKALDVVSPVAEEKGIRLIPELSELYVAVHVDPDLFGQAIINLLSNAIKYTPAGGEVRLRSRMDEDDAVIEVRDTGMGIPEDSLPHIFDRFYRVPENNAAAAGTGLGLALVHYLVTDVHNGTIDVDSTVNAGTCFTVRIPVGHLKPNRRKQEQTLCTV